MKFLSFRTIYLCILLPPLMYAFAIPALEAYLKKRWAEGLRDALIPDIQLLLEGQQRIEESIERGVSRYLAAQPLVRWGALPTVMVRTATGRILYPRYSYGSQSQGADKTLPTPSREEAQENAAYNIKAMEEGILLNLEVRVPANTWIASGVFLFSILLSCAFLYRVYTARVREAARLDQENRAELQRTSEELSKTVQELNGLREREGALRGRIAALQHDLELTRSRVHATEEQALEEMEALETKLRESTVLREKMELEVERLRKQLAEMESASDGKDGKTEGRAEAVRRRFSALYKGLAFSPRAVDGFLALPIHMQIKAEQTIHNLDRDPGLVPVRRKVFFGKGGAAVLETEFAHKGRLYWARMPEGRLAILAVGTKNTQERDMAFLRTLEL